MLDVQTTAEGVEGGKSRKETKQNNKEEIKVSQCDGETLFCFKLKLSCFIRDTS